MQQIPTELVARAIAAICEMVAGLKATANFSIGPDVRLARCNTIDAGTELSQQATTGRRGQEGSELVTGVRRRTKTASKLAKDVCITYIYTLQ